MFQHPSCRHVIKGLVHAFSCAYIELWIHLGSLESTQEARVALSCRLEQPLTLLSCSPNFPRASITGCTHATHETILNYVIYSHYISRGGEWSFKEHRSRKIFVEFQGSRSLLFLAAMCVSRSRFSHKAVSQSQFLQG